MLGRSKAQPWIESRSEPVLEFEAPHPRLIVNIADRSDAGVDREGSEAMHVVERIRHEEGEIERTPHDIRPVDPEIEIVVGWLECARIVWHEAERDAALVGIGRGYAEIAVGRIDRQMIAPGEIELSLREIGEGQPAQIERLQIGRIDRGEFVILGMDPGISSCDLDVFDGYDGAFELDAVDLRGGGIGREA